MHESCHSAWGRIASCARLGTAQSADEIGAQVEKPAHIRTDPV
jgi:hypothetical protein